ncbi:MAG TPA: PilZ domain-containing protein [Candidatus Saccharimonadales bacterium]|nr:PilZ domain-containing protein [Candidatus Saccharimonadales bacterium]
MADTPGHLAEVQLRFAGPGDALLVSHAPVLRDDWPARKSPNASGPNATPTLGASRERVPQIDPLLNQAAQALRIFQLLLRTSRLYTHSHPSVLDSLDQAYDALRDAATELQGLEVRIERGGIVVPKLAEGHLPDARGEFHSLANDLQRAGIHTLFFSTKFHVGELDTLTQLIHATLLHSEESAKRLQLGGWSGRLRERRVEGIQINTLTERKVDSVLASLIAALVAYGGNAPQDSIDAPIRAPQIAEVSETLRLIGRLTPPMEVARGLSPEEAARAIHASMESASRDTVRMLLSAMNHYAPLEGETPQAYLRRLSQSLVLELMTTEFADGSLAPAAVRPVLCRLAEEIVSAGEYRGPHSSQHFSSLASSWANDGQREQLIERFWLELAPREKSLVLRGPEIWCVPVSVIRQTLSQLVEAGAEAPRREARTILLNYARRLDQPDPAARRVVAAGLGELTHLLESLWPNQLPEELNKLTMNALAQETAPETSALLAAFLETLGRIAVTRGDFPGFENILVALERLPHDAEHEHMTALGHRLMANDRWTLLVDAAIANRPLDPALPRLLQRDPDRLLDRLTLLLTDPRGPEMLAPMARLLRSIGVPVLTVLETRLFEARRQRVSAAIRMLAAADPDRLLRGLTRAMASWEWNLQDLAVSELSRPSNSPTAQSTAFVFSAILQDAHPLVVPMMIDQIGIALEATAVPLLMEIAAGEHDTLRDQFVRIKAIEALGRLRAVEAVDLLRQLAGRREGLTYVEPGGLRAAAEDALAMMEDGPQSARARAAFEPAAPPLGNFVIPRRYARIPLESPLRAQIGGPQISMARIKTISLGGAFVESPNRLNPGDSIQLEIRSGLRKIHSTAIVRNVGPNGNGVEFVHMKDEDREKLRRLVQKYLSV